MKKSTILLVCTIFIVSNHLWAKEQLAERGRLCFIENKGQIKDQSGNNRGDIQFFLPGNGITVFVGSGQLHYQFCKRSSAHVSARMPASFDKKAEPETFEMYRMDVDLLNANTNAEVISEEKQDYAEHYYLPGCGENGIHASTYKKITYKNIYPKIDWVIYVNGNEVKHEFVVKAGGSASDIQIRYNGQKSVKLNSDGSLTAVTAMGTITENAPICYADGGTVTSAFKLMDNVLSYKVGAHTGQLIIDPTLSWGTYYGPDSIGTFLSNITTDDSGNVYSGGSTYSVIGEIATTGSYQFTSGGATDGMIVKFDSAGHRLWATYYGGSGNDIIDGISYDHSGNIYIGGSTTSSSGISTVGSHQAIYGGGANSLLAKFRTDGTRVWATYIGGTGYSFYQSVSCDTLGHVFISGVTNDVSSISTPGSHMPVMSAIRDCFLEKFDSSGVRMWGTYYGGTGDDMGGACSSDGKNVYLSGYTTSASGISSPLSYQSTLTAGGPDAFIARFDSAGHRDWGTYYGGADGDETGGLACNNGFIYLLGSTSSLTGIASPGSAQPVSGGTDDAFLVRFDPLTGYRIWGTYFGGPGTENTSYSMLVSDKQGNVAITGSTTSTSGIASVCAWQSTYGGGNTDAFLAKYDTSGKKLWSTFYGGIYDDVAWGCACIGARLYMCGYTNSVNNIATSGAFLPVGGSSLPYFQGFIAKFFDDSAISTHSDTMFCATNELYHFIIPAPAGGSNYFWYDSSTATEHAIDSGGNYVVSYNMGCNRITNTIHVVYNFHDFPCNVGVHEVINSNSDKLSIYPNPATDECTFSVTANGSYPHVAIFDITGRLYRDYSLSGNKITISVADLPAGIYQCKVSVDDHELAIKKLVVIR